MRRVVICSFVVVAALFFLTTTGCGREPAPEGVDNLSRFFFDNFDPTETDKAGVDATLQDGIAKMHVALEGDSLAEPASGILTEMTDAEVEATGLTDVDTSILRGIYIANIIHCPIDRMQEILLETDQLSLYPEAYAEYGREYDADRPAHFPTWTVTYTSAETPPITNQWTATIKNGLRQVDPTSDSKFGKALLRRGFFPEAAVFESEGSSFQYDFQVETYHERAPGEIVHFYGIWRFMELGVLGNSNDGFVVDFTINGMIDWDTKTDALCAE